MNRPLFLLLFLLPLCSVQGWVPTVNEGAQFVEHETYYLLYNEEHEQADWVAYILRDDMLSGGVDRTDNFRSDPNVTTGSASLSDYKGSGYDRGHLCPAGDRTYSDSAMSETFYLSNMSPQDPSFNRGIWRKLETLVRTWAGEHGQLLIVTGPVLKAGGIKTIGENGVTVPKSYFKAILDYREPDIKAIGFILPNQRSAESLSSFAVSIDKVEEATGFDLYPFLDDEEEERIESETDHSAWSLRVWERSARERTEDSANSPRRSRSTVRRQKDNDWEAEWKGTAKRQNQSSHWLTTKSRVRHNRGCRYYNNSRGRFCGPNEGRACKICGG